MAKKLAKKVEKKERKHRALGGAVYRVKRGDGYLPGWHGKRSVGHGKYEQRQLVTDETDIDGAELAFAKWSLDDVEGSAEPGELAEFARSCIDAAASSPRAAEYRALAERAMAAANKQKVDPRTGRLTRTLGQVIDEFLAYKGSLVTEYHTGTLKMQLERFRDAKGLGADCPIAEVTRPTVESFMAELGKKDGQKRSIEGAKVAKGKKAPVETKPMSANTQRHYLSAVGALFKFALDRQYVAVNAARGVKLRKVQQYEPFVLTAEAVSNLYAHMPARIRDVVVLLGETGCRFGEIANVSTTKRPGHAGLLWDEVDCHGFAYIHLTRATKSYKNRKVPLTKRASDLLRGLYAARNKPMRGEDPVFAPVSKEWFHKRFRDARKAAGLPPKATIHSLRHSYCVALTMANVPFSVSAKILGHSTPAFTATRYGRWVPDGEEERAVAALDRARNGNASAPPVAVSA